LAAWGKRSGDPDPGTLADWIDEGAPAPLGFTEPITTNGVFPAVDPVKFCPEPFSLPLDRETLDKFRAAKGDPKHTTLWEGLALLVAFRLWLPRVGFGATFRVKSDSLSSLLMLSKGRAKSPELNVIAREVALDQALLVYRLTFLEHIPGVTNLEADFLSRVFAPQVPVKPRQLEGVPLAPFEIGAGFWKVTKLA
jgi:hypothetical protein